MNLHILFNPNFQVSGAAGTDVGMRETSGSILQVIALKYIRWAEINHAVRCPRIQLYSAFKSPERRLILTSRELLNEGKPPATHGDALHQKRVPLVHSAELKLFPQQRRLSREPTIKRKNNRERSRKSCLEYSRQSSFYKLLRIILFILSK